MFGTGKADADGDQLISLDELYRYTYEHVRTENTQQSPHKSGDVEGDIILARNPQPPRAAELPLHVQEAIESPIPEVREGIVRTLDKLLSGKNRGLALVARAALVELKEEDDSRKVASAAEACLLAWEKAEAERHAAEQEEGERPAPLRPAKPVLKLPRTEKPGSQEATERERPGELASIPESAAQPLLADHIGARGPSIDWRRGSVFFVASLTSTLVFLIDRPGTQTFLMIWMGLDSLILTGCTLGAFRWIRNPFWAVSLAAATNALLGGVCWLTYWSIR